jgi:glycosyltransferase involved in cell wall biosynthesis
MASLFVYPSVFEGFGIPIIEALYSKTPVITSTGSCFFEAGGANSIYINPTDVESLSYNISLVLNDEKLRIDMIDKGFKFVQKFDDAIIAKNYLSIYNSLIK